MHARYSKNVIASAKNYVCPSCRYKLVAASFRFPRRLQHTETSTLPEKETSVNATLPAGPTGDIWSGKKSSDKQSPSLKAKDASFKTAANRTASSNDLETPDIQEKLKQLQKTYDQRKGTAQKAEASVSRKERRALEKPKKVEERRAAKKETKKSKASSKRGKRGESAKESQDEHVTKAKKSIRGKDSNEGPLKVAASKKKDSVSQDGTKAQKTKAKSKAKAEKKGSKKASKDSGSKPRKEISKELVEQLRTEIAALRKEYAQKAGVKQAGSKSKDQEALDEEQLFRKIRKDFRKVNTDVPTSLASPKISKYASASKVLDKAMGKALGKSLTTPDVKSSIEKVEASTLKITPINVHRPPVPMLTHGLERVLFNPGVYQLQDPRSRVYNFDPYLQKVMPVAEFDFNALKEFITSSKDQTLIRVAHDEKKRYVGSTSSMTGVLSHFHFLLSQWRPINTKMLSREFPAEHTNFTELQRCPSAIFLRWKDGTYAIDADKQFANANVLSMLGKSLEKLLTLKTEDYEKYRKSNPDQVSEEEQLAPEAYHYSTLGDFLMRSQLDAHHPRLPGAGMFDLKTRAVVSIRMDVQNFEEGVGYQIKDRQGAYESYEREYYDMIRAAFLKYSMQVRMGRMDGIFVAYHNIEQIFGFQYVPLGEMDSTIHGQYDTALGDQEFASSLDLLNKILDRATKKYPNTSLRIHFETRDAATPFMYIFAEPVTEDQVTEIQSLNETKIRDFEAKILGLDSAKDIDNVEGKDDGTGWEDIEANVQDAMDKDELGLEAEPGNLSSSSAEMDGQQRHSGEGNVLANRDRQHVPADLTAVTPTDVDNDDDDEEEEEEEQEDDEDEDDEDDEDDGDEEEQEEEEEEDDDHEEDSDEDEEDREDANEDAGGEQEDDNEDKSKDVTREAGEQTLTDTPDGQTTGAPDKPGEAPSENIDSANEKSVPSSSDAVKKGFLPSESEEGPPFQTQADKTFLDEMDGAPAPSREILAMTLTLRNQVNGSYVLRPEKLSPNDKWSIEYSLVEVPEQRRAWALYEACQTRRQKKLDGKQPDRDDEKVNYYVQNLRKLATEGREWREEMAQKDKERPVHILGQELKGEGSLIDQDPEA